MTSGYRIWLPALAVCLLPAVTLAERPDRVQPETVEMFAAMEDGLIDVRIIPKDSTRSRVLVENKTDKPLRVQLPDAFAAVPVQAQFGGGGFGGGGRGGGGLGGGGFGGQGGGGFGGGGQQGLGGGFGGGGQGGGGFGGGGQGGGGFGGGGFGGGGGQFNVAPEQVGQIKVTTVCLEHGKAEPRAAVPYTIVPIEEFTDNAEVHEVCRMLGSGMLNQRVAQVAAWNLNNQMSFQELAAKRIRRINGPNTPYFAPQEIRAGMQAVAVAANIARQRRAASANGSLSQN